MNPISKTLAVAVATTLAAASLATVAEARNDAAPGVSTRSSTTGVTRNLSASGTRAISAPNVRVAIHFDYEFGITRSKGVTLVRNPSAGLYCVRPANMTSATVRSLTPQVTVDFSASAGQVLLAYYRSNATACQSNEIGIQTKRLASGRYVNSDNVGWTMIAP